MIVTKQKKFWKIHDVALGGIYMKSIPNLVHLYLIDIPTGSQRWYHLCYHHHGQIEHHREILFQWICSKLLVFSMSLIIFDLRSYGGC